MRCLTLADALAARGGRCLFVSREHEGALFGAIHERGRAVAALPLMEPQVASSAEPQLAHAAWLGADWREDAAQTKAALGDASVDWLIVDHYALDIRWERELRPFCKRLMVIDDLADRAHDCDLLLDQNLGRAVKDYATLVPKTARILAGPRFALLRPEFAAKRAESLARRAQPKLRNILVTMGGVDQHNVTERVLDAVEDCGLPGDVSVTVVMGGAAPWLESVRAKASRATRPIQVLVDVRDMARLMTECDLAIGAAGTTSWERACLGVPTFVVVLAENQSRIGAALAASGAASLIELSAIEADLRIAFDEIAKDNMWLQTMCAAAASLTEGAGAETLAFELVGESAR
jgi:UDP-2,4-diacetamido-2,4,6-trideoxy-beta-L-altropyranose hydrolase